MICLSGDADDPACCSSRSCMLYCAPCSLLGSTLRAAGLMKRSLVCGVWSSMLCCNISRLLWSLVHRSLSCGYLMRLSGLGRSHRAAQVRGLQNGAGDVIADIISFQHRDALAVGALRDWGGAVRKYWRWQALTGF